MSRCCATFDLALDRKRLNDAVRITSRVYSSERDLQGTPSMHEEMARLIQLDVSISSCALHLIEHFIPMRSAYLTR